MTRLEIEKLTGCSETADQFKFLRDAGLNPWTHDKTGEVVIYLDACESVGLFMPPDEGLTQLYRHWDKDDNLLYVGISLSAVQRTSQHKRLAGWFPKVTKITIEHFDSREAALKAEKKAIRKEEPRFNKAHSK